MATNKQNAAEQKDSNSVSMDVQFKSIRVYSAEDSIRYRVILDANIPAIQKDGDQYVETEADYIDFLPRVIIAQCITVLPELGAIYTKKQETALRNGSKNGFGAAELQILLQGANVTIERTKFLTGETYTTADGEVDTHKHDGYNTTIKGIQLSPVAQKIMDNLLAKVFDF